MIKNVNKADSFLKRKVNLKIDRNVDNKKINDSHIKIPLLRGILGRKSFE